MKKRSSDHQIYLNALGSAADSLSKQAANLRFACTADISEDTANEIVADVRRKTVDALEKLSDAWGFDSIANLIGPVSE